MDLEILAQRLHAVFDALGNAGFCHSAVGFDPVFLDAGDDFPDCPADDPLDGEPRLSCEGRVDLDVAKIDGESRRIVDHLTKREALVHRLEEVPETLLALLQRLLCTLALGNIHQDHAALPLVVPGGRGLDVHPNRGAPFWTKYDFAEFLVGCREDLVQEGGESGTRFVRDEKVEARPDQSSPLRSQQARRREIHLSDGAAAIQGHVPRRREVVQVGVVPPATPRFAAPARSGEPAVRAQDAASPRPCPVPRPLACALSRPTAPRPVRARWLFPRLFCLPSRFLAKRNYAGAV